MENLEGKLGAVIEATTKEELFRAAANLRNHLNPDQEPDPEFKALIDERIATFTNAAPAPGFAIPYSVRLVALMVKNLGKGAYALIDGGAWTHLIGDSQTCQCLDPVARHKQILAGHMGVLFGMNIYTDAYRLPEEMVLPKNSLTVMSEDGSKGYTVQLA